MSGDCLPMILSTPQLAPSKPMSEVLYPISSTVLRTRASTSTQALVVTSPATITTPVLTRVSQATRPRGSAARMASSTASEIWSATLSGWPSETDSDVKEKLLLIEIPQDLSEIFLVPPLEISWCEFIVLRPARLDFEGPHERGRPADGFPIQALKQSVN